MTFKAWLFGGAAISRLDAVRLIVASPDPVRTGPEDPKNTTTTIWREGAPGRNGLVAVPRPRWESHS